MEKKEKIQHIMNSGRSLGPMVQDILEAHGIENRVALEAGHAISDAISQHLNTLGQIFMKDGHRKCGKALLFEAKTLYAD